MEGVKKYAQILADMEHKIASGHYRAGQRVPSVREAAQQYGVSPGTIVKAYAELETRHAIYSIPQSGYYVVDQAGGEKRGGEHGAIDFSSSSPDAGLFPHQDFQHCLNKAFEIYGRQLFNYGDLAVTDILRRTLASHLADSQVFAKAERIMLTAGIQHALGILTLMPFPNGKTEILVEQPSYNLYLRFLEAERLPVSWIMRTSGGIDLDELEAKFRSGRIKFFYTMSRFHNPLGTTLSGKEREAVAKLAGKYDVYVVEDDYMADLGEVKGFEPIFAHDRTSHVIYLKSFSKIIFPGLRLGAAVLPEPLIDTFRHYSRFAETSVLSQAVLDVYIKNGMYARHRRGMYKQYAARNQRLHEALRKQDPEHWIEAPSASSGLYTHFRLPRTVNLERLVRRLAERKVAVTSGKPYYLSDCRDRDKFLRISVSRADPNRIEEGIRAIVEEIGHCGR